MLEDKIRSRMKYDMETFGLRNRYGKTQNTPVSLFLVTFETFLQHCCRTNISIKGGELRSLSVGF